MTEVRTRLRRMFDLDADLIGDQRASRARSPMARLVAARPALRVFGGLGPLRGRDAHDQRAAGLGRAGAPSERRAGGAPRRLRISSPK